MKPLRYIPAAALLAAAMLLYLPTLRTGFITDDYLDCSHTFGEAAGAFTGESSGGYRPLMTLAWAVDNAL